MPRFFENICKSIDEEFMLNDENSKHCSKVLRMQCGDEITVCNGGNDYECEIVFIDNSGVTCKVKNVCQSASEPDIDVTLFQCLPKSDKLETVIQKSVELGVGHIVPVLSSRCVSRPDDKKRDKKIERYNKIAKSACEQSGRGFIVSVGDIVSFDEMAKSLKNFDLAILFYEGGGMPISELIGSSNLASGSSVAIIIGPEGGFAENEVELAEVNGAQTATLGKRILRTETAPLAALTAIMLLSGNMD